MNIYFEKAKNTFTSKKNIFIPVLIFLLVSTGLLIPASYSVLTKDTFHLGVHINDINVGNFSKEYVRDILTKEYANKVKTNSITMRYNGFEKNIDFSELDVSYNLDSAIKSAYKVGRQGNFFKNLFDIIKVRIYTSKIRIPFSFNEENLQKKLQEFYTETFIEMKNPDVIIDGENVYIYTGRQGESIDIDKAFERITKHISLSKSVFFSPITNTVYPNELQIESLYSELNKEPTNAEFKLVNNEIIISPEVVGTKINMASLERIVSQIKNIEDFKYLTPVEIIQPEITYKFLKKNLFKDTLSTTSTHFSTNAVNNANRATNIRLSASKINGTILLPGDIFSFNDVVGVRNSAAGYKSANVFVNGKIVTGIGGGICQVSTTLYNAVLYADLKTLERVNHMFTVGYVPLGMDAAVSYGYVDYRFQNTTNWPIKIVNNVSENNELNFSIIGTNENPKKTVEYERVILRTKKPPFKYTYDPQLPKNKEVILNNGQNGYTVDTYKKTFLDGNLVERVKIHTSIYNPLEVQIKKGTKEINDVVSLPKTQPNTIVVEAIDDAHNPPATNSDKPLDKEIPN